MTLQPLDDRPTILDWRDEMIAAYGSVENSLTSANAYMMHQQCQEWLAKREETLSSLKGEERAAFRKVTNKHATAIRGLEQQLANWIAGAARKRRA